MQVEEFAQAIKASVVEENIQIYRQAFEDTREARDPYWIRADKLYRSLDQNQKEIFFEIIRQVEIDTISNLFAIIDGRTSYRDQDDEDCALFCGPDRLDPYLQDSFLALFEEE